MSYLNLNVPPYPSFIISGNATYRPGDIHAARASLPCADLILVEEGVLFMMSGSEEYALSKNSLLLIPPNTSHRGYKICRQKSVFHWLHLGIMGAYEISDIPISTTIKQNRTANLSEIQFSTVSIPLYQILSKDNSNEIRSTFKMLETVSFNRFEKSTLAFKPTTNLFHQNELLMHILRRISLMPPATDINDIAYKCMQYITAHYAEPIALADLAEIANCHPTHVIRCMKNQYGCAPIQTINNIRLQRACELLQQTDAPITSIAFSTGFSSPAYFSKQFKLAYNMSPSGYRDLHLHRE